MREIGVGLIGFGLGGRAFHAPFIRTTPGLDLRAIVSRDAAKVHAIHRDVDVAPDVDALLAREDVDLVVVSSPDALHAAHARAALLAGRHVLVDKPFAATLAEARDIAALAEDRGRILTVFHNRRWDADFLTLRKVIAAGTLGDIVQFESRFDRWRPHPAAVWKEERDGGAWFDLGPHLVDQALTLFGRPDAVTADLANFRTGVAAPDYFHVVLHYPDRRAILQASKLVRDHALRFAVHGTRGSWIKHGVDPQEQASIAGIAPGTEDWGHDSLPGRIAVGDTADGTRPLPNERGDYPAFWRALAAAIRGEGANPVPAAEALATMEVLDAGLRSCAERRTISLGRC